MWRMPTSGSASLAPGSRARGLQAMVVLYPADGEDGQSWPRLEAEIPAGEARLHEPDFYARDPKGIDAVMQGLASAREKLASAEQEWLELEEKRAG